MSAKGLSRDNIVKDIKTSKQFRRAIRYRGLTSDPLRVPFGASSNLLNPQTL